MKLKRILSIGFLFLGLFACNHQDTLISKNQVGKLNQKSTIQEIAVKCKEDKVLLRANNGSFYKQFPYVLDTDTYILCNQKDEILFAISPVLPNNPKSTIKTITIFSDLYHTENGIRLSSTFEQLLQQHQVEKVEASFQFLTVFVKDLNATFIIDKIAAGMSAYEIGSVSISEVPKNATFKMICVWFD